MLRTFSWNCFFWRFSEKLEQEHVKQTRSMVATMLVNAFLFQENLAGG
jgi:hypothetical protein